MPPSLLFCTHKALSALSLFFQNVTIIMSAGEGEFIKAIFIQEDGVLYNPNTGRPVRSMQCKTQPIVVDGGVITTVGDLKRTCDVLESENVSLGRKNDKLEKANKKLKAQNKFLDGYDDAIEDEANGWLIEQENKNDEKDEEIKTLKAELKKANDKIDNMKRSNSVGAFLLLSDDEEE